MKVKMKPQQRSLPQTDQYPYPKVPESLFSLSLPRAGTVRSKHLQPRGALSPDTGPGQTLCVHPLRWGEMPFCRFSSTSYAPPAPARISDICALCGVKSQGGNTNSSAPLTTNLRLCLSHDLTHPLPTSRTLKGFLTPSSMNARNPSASCGCRQVYQAPGLWHLLLRHSIAIVPEGLQ